MKTASFPCRNWLRPGLGIPEASLYRPTSEYYGWGIWVWGDGIHTALAIRPPIRAMPPEPQGRSSHWARR